MSASKSFAIPRRVGLWTGTLLVAVAATIGVGLTANVGAAIGPVPAATPTVNPTDAPPSPPTNLAATVTSTSVRLTWTTAVPTGAISIAEYDIQYARAFNDVLWTTSVAGNVTSATITSNIQPASQYQFTVRAKDILGHYSAGAASIVVVTPVTDTGPDTTPPSMPTNLAVSSVGPADAILTWSPSTDNGGVTGYNVYQFDGLFVSTLIATVTGTTATVPLAAPPHTYYVRARDAIGNLSLASNTVSTGGTSSSPPPSTAPSTCQVTYAVQSQWPGGFVAAVTISNTGSSAINAWTLAFNFPGDQQITNSWSATVSQNGAAVTARNLSWNAGIPAGGNVTFGFQGTWTASLASPTDYSVNGLVCLAS
ncbi:MAG: glucanase [Catenulispora sp.]|nr:glucanase [Catenulispora sp.]